MLERFVHAVSPACQENSGSPDVHTTPEIGSMAALNPLLQWGLLDTKSRRTFHARATGSQDVIRVGLPVGPPTARVVASPGLYRSDDAPPTFVSPNVGGGVQVPPTGSHSQG